MGSTDHNWTVPAGVTTYDVECWGAGGGGQNGGSHAFYGSGGGGAYSRTLNLSATVGHTYLARVGNGGAHGSADGGDTEFRGESASTDCLAKGGKITFDGTGGLGGAAGSGTGDVKFSGGNGGAGDAAHDGGAGGGGSGGRLSNGNSGGAAGVGVGAGGAAVSCGGAGANGTTGTGLTATECGGGGGAGVLFFIGGDGAGGAVRIWKHTGVWPPPLSAFLQEYGNPPSNCVNAVTFRAYAFVM